MTMTNNHKTVLIHVSTTPSKHYISVYAHLQLLEGVAEYGMVSLQSDGAVRQADHVLPHVGAEIHHHHHHHHNYDHHHYHHKSLRSISNHNVFKLSEIIEDNIVQVQIESPKLPEHHYKALECFCTLRAY